MVNLWCSASDRVRVRRRTSTEAFQTCDAGRARVQLPSEAGTPDMTIGGADADRAGARPYLRRRPSGSVLLFLGLHTYELLGGEKKKEGAVKRWFKPVNGLGDAGNSILYDGLQGSPLFRD